eukprot:6066217-Heterocapsa_arctica.AAC.1
MASVSVTRNVGRDKLWVGILAAYAPFGESQGPFHKPFQASRGSRWPPLAARIPAGALANSARPSARAPTRA